MKINLKCFPKAHPDSAIFFPLYFTFKSISELNEVNINFLNAKNNGNNRKKKEKKYLLKKQEERRNYLIAHFFPSFYFFSTVLNLSIAQFHLHNWKGRKTEEKKVFLICCTADKEKQKEFLRRKTIFLDILQFFLGGWMFVKKENSVKVRNSVWNDFKRNCYHAFYVKKLSLEWPLDRSGNANNENSIFWKHQGKTNFLYW